jgi:hypothetical protein
MKPAQVFEMPYEDQSLLASWKRLASMSCRRQTNPDKPQSAICDHASPQGHDRSHGRQGQLSVPKNGVPVVSWTIVADVDDSLSAKFNLANVGASQHLINSLLRSAVVACSREGVLRLIVDDDSTKRLLCSVLHECGLHPPHAKKCGLGQVYQFYINLYSRSPG